MFNAGSLTMKFQETRNYQETPEIIQNGVLHE